MPHQMVWGYLAVLIYMTGNGVETNFIAPHMAEAFGGGDDKLNLAATIITCYNVTVLIASYLAGVLSDLWGPRKVMLLGVIDWVAFQVLFLFSLEQGSVVLTTISYTLRGFGFPLFAFAVLMWINAIVDRARSGAAIGWFYVMYTGGLSTIGALVALFLIPTCGGGMIGERWAMTISTVIVLLGFVVGWLGVKEQTGYSRLAPPHMSTREILTSGLVLTTRNRGILLGFLVRLINTAPQFGMFIILPTVIAVERGWGQSRWLIMSSVVYAANILFNAAFGALGDRIGWVKTVRWFGILGASIGLLAWWYVPHMVPAGSDWGYYLSLAGGVLFGIMLAGFVPLGAIMPAMAPNHRGAAMAMYTTAAGGAGFLGSAVVAIVRPWAGNVGVVWAFILLYVCSFIMTFFMKFSQPGLDDDVEPEITQEVQ